MTNPADTLLRHVFDSMAVEVEVFVDDAPASVGERLSAVEREFARLEAIFSRFSPRSELSRLNAAGRLVVGDDLLTLTELALEARARTGGLVDPTVHGALVAWGYDRTFADVLGGERREPAVVPACGGSVHVDRAASTVELEHGVTLDFGGLAKGYAVDRACDILGGRCLVNAGGDLALRSPDGEPWAVGVELPERTLTLHVSGGAVATSGTAVRRWRAGDVDAHHLIDPRTCAPSHSDLVRATAWGATAVEAEIRAKTLFLLGAVEGAARADAEGIPAVLVPAEGDAVLAGGLE